MRRALLALSLITLSATAALTLEDPGWRNSDLGWREYRNQRFGITLVYPSRVFRFERASTAGDGELFVSRDGRAQLLIGALENQERYSPASYQRFIASQSYPGLKVDYAPVGGTWTVLSGTMGEMMVYEKAMFSCGGRMISSFAMTYPVEERRLYDRIVEEIEHTFRPGREGCSQHATTNP
jgi:hypothetical protein